MHLLYKVHFWARKEKIFCSKNITKSHAIFLLREVGQGSKKIQELSQDFWSYKNWGCFGALISEISFQKKMNIFTYEKYSMGHSRVFERKWSWMRCR